MLFFAVSVVFFIDMATCKRQKTTFVFGAQQIPCQTQQIFPSSRKMMKNFDREKLSK